MPYDKIDELYDALKKDGAVSKSRENFRSKMLAPGKEGYQNRLQLYNALKADGAVESPTYEEFSKRLGMHAVTPQTTTAAPDSVPSAAPAGREQAPSQRERQGWKPGPSQEAQFARVVADTRQALRQGRQRLDNLREYAGLRMGRQGGQPAFPTGAGRDKPTVFGSENVVRGGIRYNPGTGRMEQTYLTQGGNRYASRMLADMEQRRIDEALERELRPVETGLRDAYAERDRLDEALKKRMKEIDARPGRRFNDFMREAAAASTPGAGPAGEADARMSQYENDDEYMQLMAAARKNRQTIQLLEDKKNGRMNSFWHSLATTASNGYTFSDGMSEMRDAIALQNASKHVGAINRKRAEGKPLSKEEEASEAVLWNFATDDMVQGMYGGDYGAMARAGGTTAASFDFMKDILLVPSAGGVAKGIMRGTAKGMAKGLAKLTGKEAARLWKSSVARRMLKATGVPLGAHAAGLYVANTAGIGRTGAVLGTLSSGEAVVDGAGSYKVENAMELLPAFVEAERRQAREYGSEMFGEFIPGVGGAVKKGLEKIGLSKLSGAMTRIGGKEWYRQYGSLLAAGGYNGLPGEALEEYEGSLFDALTGHAGDAWDDMTSLRHHTDIWLGCATTGALLGSVPMAVQGYHTAQYYRYKHNMDKADRVASFRLTAERWEPLRDKIDGTPNEGMADVLTQMVLDPGLDVEEKKAVLNYARNLAKMRGHNIAQVNNANDDGEQRPEVRSVNDSYSSGYETTDPQAVNDARNRLDMARAQVAKDFGIENVDEVDALIGDDPLRFIDEQRKSGNDTGKLQSVIDYANAKSAYDGMVQRGNDDMENRRMEVAANVERHTHKDNGAVQPATMKVDGRQVYIVKGNIVPLPDGTGIDARNSDQSIVVCDAETGEYKFTSPDQIFNVGGPIDPQAELDEAYANIQAEHDAMTGGNGFDSTEISNPMPQYGVNDTFTMLDADGNSVGGEVQGVGADGVEIRTDAPLNGRYVQVVPVEEFENNVESINDADGNPVWAREHASDAGATADTSGSIAPQDEDVVTPTPATEELVQMARKGNELAQRQLEAQGVRWEGPAEQQQTALSRVPLDEETGEPMFEKADEETALDALNEATGGNEANTAAIVNAQVEQAQKALDALKKKRPAKKAPALKGSPMAMLKAQQEADASYNAAMEQYNGQVAQAEETLSAWSGIYALMNERKRAVRERQEAERRERDKQLHDEAAAQAQADYGARKRAEAEREAVGNERPMPAIADKWDNAPKVDGHKDEMMLPDGTLLKGRYVLHESGASSPSHNPLNWQKTEGFPMDANDNSVNDRDYERDRDAQEHTERIARNYDQRALQSVPVVSGDGVVLSGNGRTMAGEMAARNNTDGAYLDYLKEHAHKWGFTPGQVEGMQHPRVSFVPDEAMPYTAETFAKFNQQEMKSQNKTEQAVKLGKTVGDDSFKRIVRAINAHDTLGEFYNDPRASLGAVYYLHNAGVVPQEQLAEMVDGVRGQEKLSAVGREFLENMLIGKAFDSDPDVVRMLTAEPAMRQSVITALGEIADNVALGGEWALRDELAGAVKLCFDARKGGAGHGDIVSIYARQGVLFADPDQLQTVADFNNATMLMVADVLNDKRVTLLKTTIALYNQQARESARGQMDLFTGDIQSRENILRDVIKFINNGKRKEIEAARAAAVERRKAESVQQDGAPPAVSGEGEGAAHKDLSADDGRGNSGSIGERQGSVSPSAEVDENGIPFVKSDDGSTIFGEIREDSGLSPAPIKLSQGFQDENGKGYGLAHIEANHGGQIRNAGFASVEDFVRFVAQNYDEDNIRVGKRRENGNTTYLIQATDEHDNTLFIEMSRDGSYWNVNSAGVFRKGYSNKKETVAKTEPQQPTNAVSTGSSLSVSEVGGITPTEPNGKPTVSAGKNMDNPSTLQENGGISSGNKGGTPLSEQIAEASADVDTEPTEAQKEAGNYKKGHVRVGAFDITIEQPERKRAVRERQEAERRERDKQLHDEAAARAQAGDVDNSVVSSSERAEMENRITGWLSEENLERAVGKTREEIFEEFGNELAPIAYIPEKHLSLFGDNVKDSRIYCGKGYFIDHALRNHGGQGTQIDIDDVDVSKYLNIQYVLDNPDHIKETFTDGKRTVVFIKKIGRYFAELTQLEENGRIVLHKSLFNQKKEPYAKLADIRQKGASSEGGASSISHAENTASAISLESRGDAVSSADKGSGNVSEKQARGGEKSDEKDAVGSEMQAKTDVYVGTLRSLWSKEKEAFEAAEKKVDAEREAARKEFEALQGRQDKTDEEGARMAKLVEALHKNRDEHIEKRFKAEMKKRYGKEIAEAQKQYMELVEIANNAGSIADVVNAYAKLYALGLVLYQQHGRAGGRDAEKAADYMGRWQKHFYDYLGTLTDDQLVDEAVKAVAALGSPREVLSPRAELSKVVEREAHRRGKGRMKAALKRRDEKAADAKTEGEGDAPLSEQIAAASADVDTAPTEAQKAAGNYRKGHVRVGAFDITIEQPEGSVRRGTDADGRQWESRMHNAYGYFRGTEGVDGDHIDVFLSTDIDGWNGREVFVVDQYNPDGGFDEHKVMLGFNGMGEAKSDYLANYEKGWEDGRRITVSATSLEDFEKWIASSHRKTKPFAEYAAVKKETVANAPAREEAADDAALGGKLGAREQKATGAAPVSHNERVLRDAVNERLREAGMDVIGDAGEGQRVLDMANCKDVRLEARHRSESAEKRNRVLSTVDEAVSIVTGKPVKDVRAERRAREAEYKEETKKLYDAVLSGDFNAVTLQRINDYLDHVTPSNEYGRPLSKRLPPEVLRGVRKGERTGEVDVLFSRICESAVPAHERTRAEAKRRIEEKKKELLKGWSIATGNWHTSVADFTRNTEPIGRGKDSVVYQSDDGKSVIKVSAGKDNLKKFRPDIDAVTLFNHMFRYNPYEILGYGEVDGKFVKFLKQPFVDFAGSTPLSAEERVGYMERMGFKPMNDEKTAFSNGKFVVADLQGNNIVKDHAGNVRVIDADVKLHTRDMGGRYGYPPVEDDFPSENPSGQIREQRVYHGSGAEFNQFDHSHMGEGEGAQAYGWGTYVTETEGIGRTYAIQNTGKHNDVLRSLQHDMDAISSQITGHRDSLEHEEEQLKRANDRRAEAELDYELFQDKAEKLRKEYGEASSEYQNHLFNDIYTDEMKRAQHAVKSTVESIKYRKEKIAELEKALKDKQTEIDELPKKFPRHLYTVEIPDDNGSNYLDWNGKIPSSMNKGDIAKGLLDDIKNQEDEKEDWELESLENDINDSLEEANNGKELYKAISLYLGDKAASKFLSNAGFTGIKYPADNMRGGNKDGKKNYVIFNEADAKITDHVRFFRTASGEAYGFTVGGKIYYDPRIATSETPVHEYAHLWASALRAGNPKEWKNVVGLMRGTSVWDEVKRLYPELKADDEVADEVLAQYSGRRGAEKLREEARKIAEGNGGLFEKAEAISALERVRRALAAFWKGVCDMLHVHFTSAEEVADRVMKDLLDGVDPRKFGKGDAAKTFAEKHDIEISDVEAYENAMKQGNAQSAHWAMGNIRRTMRMKNKGLKLSEFKDVFADVRKELYARFGNLDELQRAYEEKALAERNAMEAARKKAEEEAAARQKRLDELSLISDEELDKDYMEALDKGNEATAREMLDEAARRKGYADVESDYQGEGAWAAPSNPGYESDEARRADMEINGPDANLEDIALGYNPQPDDYFSHPERYSQDTPHGRESAKAIQNALEALKRGEKGVKVKVYRAVPTSVKEGKLRNGDWVTPSKKYAEMHGNSRLEGKYRIIEDEVPAGHLWWDANDANEFGYDDGKSYRYKNARNNRKLDDLVTRDDKGNVIPPSKRFNSRKADVRYQFVGEKGAEAADRAEEVSTRLDNLQVAREMEEAKKDAKAIKMATGWERGADGKWRYEIPDIEYNPSGDANWKKILARQPWAKELEELADRIFDGEKLSDREMARFDELGEKSDELYKTYKESDVKHLDDYAPNDALYKAYPELKQTRVEFVNNSSLGWSGMYNHKDNTIFINGSSDFSYRSTLAHEIQHAIQHIEGFARGGNEQMFVSAKKAIADIRHEVDKGLDKAARLCGVPTIDEWLSSLDHEDLRGLMAERAEMAARHRHFAISYVYLNRAGYGTADRELLKSKLDKANEMIAEQEKVLGGKYDREEHDAYRALAGEVEARNVQRRMGMADEARRASLAAETEDVSREDQIFLFGDGGESHMGSRTDKRMAEIGEHYEDKALTSEEQAVVDVFSGKRDRQTVAFTGKDGNERRMLFVRGNEMKAGTKHAVYRHYNTNEGMFDADEIKKVHETLSLGGRSEKGGKIEYVYTDKNNGVEYTVAAEKKGGKERFVSFYTNRKAPNSGMQNTQSSAQASLSDASDAAKVLEKPETANGLGGNLQQAMAARVHELSERLNTPVRIVRTDEEVAALPSARQRRMKGSFNPMTGEVTIVVPNNANLADVENTFVHEVVGHDGLRVLFPEKEKLDNALDELYRVSSDGIRQTIDRTAQKMYDAEVDRLREKKRREREAKGEDSNASYYADMAEAHVEASKKRGQFRRDATEEYGADLAGRIGESGFEKMSADELTFWGKLKAMLQKALQKLLEGLKIPGKKKWSDKEWAFVLHEAYKRKKNGGRPTVFDAADTEVMRRKTGFGEAKFSDGKREQKPSAATTIADMKQRVTELFEKAKTGEFVGKPASIGRLSADGKAYLEKLSGLQFKEFVDFVLNPSDLNHIRSDHYGENEKDKGNNVPLTDEDIQDMVDVLNQPDGILYGVDKKDGRKLFFFLKDAGNGLYNLTEVCSTKKGNLTAKSFFKSKKKGISQRVMEIKGSLLPTSVTYSGESLSSDAKIPTMFDIGESSSENVADEGIMFRDGDSEEYAKAMARDAYERRVASGMYQTREALQDSMLGLKEAMEAILKAEGGTYTGMIEDVAGYENAYLGENRLSSVNQAECAEFARGLFKPMLEEVAKLAKTADERAELTDYMMAKHGLERNEVMARRAAEKKANEEFGADIRKAERAVNQNPLDQDAIDRLDDLRQLRDDREQELYLENRGKDYSGLTALTGTDNVADTEAEARRMVADYENGHKTDELWDKVNAVTGATLLKTYESGLIDKAAYDDIKGMYTHYIPLRGFDEKTSSEAYAYLADKHSAFNAPIKTAKGRKSKADDPFANMEAMAESAIMQGNRNVLVKQKFLNFALNHPSDLVSVSDLWLRHDDVRDEWMPVNSGDIAGTEALNEDDSPAEVERKMRDFEAAMEQAAKNDPAHFKKQKDAPDIPYRVVESRDLRQHQVLVKRGGKDYILTINGSPRAAQALNGQTNPDNDVSGAIGAIMRLGEAVNRQLSAFYTTRNPDFVASNFMRDMLYANTMVWVKESPNYAVRFHKNVAKCNPAMMKLLLAKLRSGTLDMNDRTERMFHQFMMNGGETGYSNIRDIERRKNDIRRELKKMGGKLPLRKAWDFLGERLDEYNRAVENCARFAAFMTSREMGRTVDRSVWDAKEISVNFNKKGSGAKFMGANGQTKVGNAAAFTSGLGRSFYVFWNAAIQGTANYGRQAKRHPKKAIAGAATMFLLGALMNYLGGGDGDDDGRSGYYNLPEHVRRSNIVFRLPGMDRQWISIPLPVEYRAMYGMGELAMSVVGGREHYTDGELAHAMAGQVSQLLPLDFMEGGGGFQAFIPSFVKPVAEALGNKSWTGMPIYKKNDYNEDDPEWTKAYKSANPYLVGASEWLNEKTGGDRYYSGMVDINPAQVEHMLNGYFGGLSRTVDEMVKMGETAAGRMEYNPRNFMFVNRLVKSGDERTEYRAVNNAYFKIKEESEALRKRLRRYENDTADGIFDYAEKIAWLNASPEYRVLETYEEYSGDIDDINEELKDPTLRDDERKELEAELNQVKKELVDAVNAVRSGSR